MRGYIAMVMRGYIDEMCNSYLKTQNLQGRSVSASDHY